MMASGNWWEHPSDYRWSLDAPAGFRTIGIIEPPAGAEPPRRAPFGFGARVLEPERVDRDPLLWDGSD